MHLRLSYLDLLGYKYFDSLNHSVFNERFEKFCADFLKNKKFKEILENHIIKRSSRNKDSFFIVTDLDNFEDCTEFIKLCELLSYRQVYSIINHEFTLRGYLTYFESPNNYDHFSLKEITKAKERLLDEKQKETKFARIVINNVVAVQPVLSLSYKSKIIQKVNTSNKTYFINPFYFLFAKDIDATELSKKFYESLKDTISKLLDESRKIEDKKPYEKYIWLTLQFDHFVRKFDLPFKPILLSKDIKYAAFSGEEQLKSCEAFLSEIRNLFGEYASTFPTVNNCLKYLKSKSRKDFSYNKTRALFIENTDAIPINTYKIVIYIINELIKKNLKDKSDIKAFDELYKGFLLEIKRTKLSNLDGFLLEEYRNNFIDKYSEKTHYFDLKS